MCITRLVSGVGETASSAYADLPDAVRDALHAAAQELAATSLVGADPEGQPVLSERSESNGSARSTEGRHPGAFATDDYNAFSDALARIAKQRGIRLTAKLKKDIQAAVAVRDESAKPVVKKRTASGVEYEPDPDLRDTEQIPLTESVDEFMAREVLPYAPDAWVADGSERIGYEISFTRYFYKPQKLRTLAEIEADILALERETDGLLEEILVNTT